MTYWYQGAEEIVRLVRLLFPLTKIVVGGIYVSLCEDHARLHLREADLLVANGDMDRFYAFLEETNLCRIGFKPHQTDLDTFPFPAFDLYNHRYFVPLLTSLGCCYTCTYCATPYHYPRHVRREPEGVIREISYWSNRGVSKVCPLR
jgi:tRNA A37 methylthiotransferase MiaB